MKHYTLIQTHNKETILLQILTTMIDFYKTPQNKICDKKSFLIYSSTK